MPSPKIIPSFYRTYLAVIKNSVGSNIFRNFYAKVNGKETDIMRNGELSYAFYISSMLVIFKLIKKIHGTVNGTIRDLKKSGWKEIKKPKIGSVLVWEKIDFGGGDIHKHIGFYIGKNKAISNSYKSGRPVIHDWTFKTKNNKTKRKIEAIWGNNKLE